MKKLFCIFAFAFLVLSGFAQSSSSVTVFSQDGEKFWVILNGIKQNNVPQTNVQVTGLTEPTYKMKVIFQDESIPSIDKTIYTKDADGKYYNVTYVVKKDKKGKMVAQLSSWDESRQNNTAQYITPLTLEEKTAPVNNQNQNTNVKQSTTVNPGGGGINVDVVDPVTGERINMNVGVNVKETGATVQTQQTTTKITTTTTTTKQTNEQIQPNNNPQPNQPNHYVMPGYTGRIGCPWPMSESDYNAAKQSISAKSFEETKLTVAKQVLGSNCMTCEQVKGIMKLFSFEDSRLDFAKFAYSRVYDPGNYYKLNDAFSFSSSVDELNEYISNQK